MEEVYRGIIAEKCKGEHDEALFVGNSLIVQCIMEGLEDYGHYLSVAYMITNAPFALEEFDPRIVLYGEGFAEYDQHYSDVTGYLWTDEALKVGGHDLEHELRSYLGKFCHLVIKYSFVPEPRPDLRNRKDG